MGNQDRVITNDPQCPVCGDCIDTSATAIVQFDAGEFLCFRTPSCVKLYRSDPDRFRNGDRVTCPALEI